MTESEAINVLNRIMCDNFCEKDVEWKAFEVAIDALLDKIITGG